MPVFRGARPIVLVIVLVPLLASCGGGNCFLGLHEKFPVYGTVQCCDGAIYHDVSVSDRGGSAEFDLLNTATVGLPSDGFLVPRTCEKLFDGPYPGSRPLCDVILGPATPGLATARVKLKTGVYRVWIQPYSGNTAPTDFWVELGEWDHRCMSSLI
jgi:hypothetical protein